MTSVGVSWDPLGVIDVQYSPSPLGQMASTWGRLVCHVLLFPPRLLLTFSSFVLLEFRIPSGRKLIGIKPRSTAENKDSELGPVASAGVGRVWATPQLPASFNQ